MFQHERNLQLENTFLLVMLNQAYRDLETLRKTGSAFYYEKTTYFTAR